MPPNEIDWTDWAAMVRELAEEEGIEIEIRTFRGAWAKGMSPEEALEEAENL